MGIRKQRMDRIYLFFIVFVSFYSAELKNGNNSMFMVQNIGNTIEELMYNKRATTLEIDLGEVANNAKFYYKGKEVKRELDGTILKEKLGIGQAIFIEIVR